MVTPPSAWPTRTAGSSVLSRSGEIFSTLSASVTLAGGVSSLPSRGRSGACALWPWAVRSGTTFSQHQPPWHAPWTSTNVAMPRSAPADDSARAGRGHEKVGHQLGARRDGVLVEIGDAFSRQHLVVDEEVAGAALGWPVEDRVGRVGHDLGFAAGLHRLVATQHVLDCRGGDRGARPQAAESDLVLENGRHLP